MITMPHCFHVVLASKRPLDGRRDGRNAAELSPTGTKNWWSLGWLVVVLLASGATVAAPMLSRTLIDWGNVSFGVPVTQSLDVTSVGDAPLELTGFLLVGYSGFEQGVPATRSSRCLRSRAAAWTSPSR